MKESSQQTSFRVYEAAIMRHVDLYKLTITACVEKALSFAHSPERPSAKAVLDSLIASKQLRTDEFPSGEKYYTRYGASRPSNTQTIDYDLATLWLCFMEPKLRFYRIETTELRSLMPFPPHHHIRHVIGEHNDGNVVYRVYPTAVDVRTTLKRLKHFVSELRNKHRLGDWLNNGDYGFVICCETEQKKLQLADSITSTRNGSRLADDARMVVTTTPTSETLGLQD